MRVQGLARRVSQACFSAERWARSSGGTFHSSTYEIQNSSAAAANSVSISTCFNQLQFRLNGLLTLPPALHRIRINHLLGFLDLAPEGPLKQARDLPKHEDGGGVLDDAYAEVGRVVYVIGGEGRAREDELDIEARERERDECEGDCSDEAPLDGRARVDPDWAPEGGFVHLSQRYMTSGQ